MSLEKDDSQKRIAQLMAKAQAKHDDDSDEEKKRRQEYETILANERGVITNIIEESPFYRLVSDAQTELSGPVMMGLVETLWETWNPHYRKDTSLILSHPANRLRDLVPYGVVSYPVSFVEPTFNLRPQPEEFVASYPEYVIFGHYANGRGFTNYSCRSNLRLFLRNRLTKEFPADQRSSGHGLEYDYFIMFLLNSIGPYINGILRKDMTSLGGAAKLDKLHELTYITRDLKELHSTNSLFHDNPKPLFELVTPEEADYHYLRVNFGYNLQHNRFEIVISVDFQSYCFDSPEEVFEFLASYIIALRESN